MTAIIAAVGWLGGIWWLALYVRERQFAEDIVAMLDAALAANDELTGGAP